MIGRDRERAQLDELLDSTATAGAALLIRGEPGVGKTTMLRHVIGQAEKSERRVLAVTGVPTEPHLPLAALHQLLRPYSRQIDRLPEPQRHALKGGFEVLGGKPPPFFMVALGTLNLLSELAADGPVLVVADDAQWIDPSTCAVLAFVARRVQCDPILLVGAIRDGHDSALSDARLPELRLSGLADGPAERLLDSQPVSLPAQVRRAILDQARGNPLALRELPAMAGRLADPVAVPGRSLALTGRLEQAFTDRAADLPASTRTLLLVAAINDGETPAETLAAGHIIAGASVTLDDLEPAVAAGLLTVGPDRLEFTHPLVRSAISGAAGAAQRHACHAALALVLAGQPNRRLWHAAAACVDPDESIAAALQVAGERARQFREISVAVAAFERSAQLSELPERRAARLLLAAESAFDMGRHDIVTRLIEQAQRLDLTELQQAQLAWGREVFHLGAAPGSASIRSLIEVVDMMRRAGEGELALRSLLLISVRSWWSGADPAAGELILQAAGKLGAAGDDPRLVAVTATAAPLTQAAAVLELSARRAVAAGPEQLRLLGLALSTVGYFDQATVLLRSASATMRRQGRLGQLAQTLISLVSCHLIDGDWDAALTAADEAQRLAPETGQPRIAETAALIAATIAAYRGAQQPTTADHAEPGAAGQPRAARMLAQLTLGVRALAERQFDESFTRLARVFDETDPTHHRALCQLALPDLAEAAHGCGRAQQARELTERFEADAALTASPLLHAALGYCRAILAAEADAERLYLGALGNQDITWPLLRGRLLLAYGSWLRRRQRSADSRRPLREAAEILDSLGATPWADRARDELRAAGEVSPGRARPDFGRLSPQEYQVSRLAAQGLTNREIGEQLFLSHRTVGAHLHSLFPKLGITARSQLARLFAADAAVQDGEVQHGPARES